MLNRDKRGSQRAVGMLDIGTSKISCLVATLPGDPRDPASALRVHGIGHQRSQGVKAGLIVDLDAAEHAVRAAVGQAERMSGQTLEEVYVGVACGRLRSQHFSASVDLESGVVRDADLERIGHTARIFAEREGRTLVHMNRLAYRIDGVQGIREPRGMSGRRLSSDFHATTADEAPLRNQLLLVERCYLSVAGLVPTALASALAATTAEERRHGVTCLDIGAGSTHICGFADGNFVFSDSLPAGGNHLSYDIAKTLVTPLEEAERIKTLYGTLVSAPSDEREAVSYPLAGEETPTLHQTTRAYVRTILQSRMEGILGLAAERFARSEVARLCGDRVVITGGVSQTVGIAELAARVLGKAVRVARPASVGGIPASVCSPAFSTVLGLATAATSPGAGMLAYHDRQALAAGYLGRMGQWLRESF